ncbi:hypothetical protein KNV50_gp13 [uncultured phage cr109_1]|uniref:Uncharacterized protein n=1 Tax=uncultured phage cr109_1 TaxID=2772083 RepID=A0A7M1RRT5_9CAUD|nr:hypothetical protein KNV50_gp13 [uncultured phage cr109_1]QOR56996.1 hypothetical protein [uncultured phage cr109_1]
MNEFNSELATAYHSVTEAIQALSLLYLVSLNYEFMYLSDCIFEPTEEDYDYVDSFFE